MSTGNFILRLILCFIFPPLAVYDKGCGMMLIVFLLCFLGWLPATIVALVVCVNSR